MTTLAASAPFPLTKGGRANGGGVYIVLLAAILLGQLGRLPVITSELKTAPVLALDLGVALVWLLLLLHLARRPSALRFERTSLLVAVFATWGLLGVVLSAWRYALSFQQVAFSMLYMARWLFYFGIFLWVTTVPAPEAAPRIASRLATAILVFAAFGIFQSVFLPDFAFVVYPEAVPYRTWDIQGHRLVSTFLDPNFAGNFIGIGLLLSLPAALRRRGSLSLRFLALLLALFLTASRGSIGGVLIGGFIVLAAIGLRSALRFLPKLLVVLVGMLLLSFVVSLATGAPTVVDAAREFLSDYKKLSVTDPSALGRLLQWEKDLELFLAHPVTGIGFDTLGFVQQNFGLYTVDNASFGLDGGLLFIAALTGSVGVLMYMAILALVVLRGLRLARDVYAPRWARDVGAVAAGVTVMWVLQGFFVNTLLYPFLMVTVWLLWGMVTIAWRQRRQWRPA
jgi:O-antigen ligase